MTLPPLVEEATRKAGACWLDVEPATPSGTQLAWHVWHDDALWLVCGGQEQAVEGLEAASRVAVRVTVTVRSREGQALTWQGTAEVVPPLSEEWATAAAVLHDKRCNAPDGEAQPQRWAAESLLVRVRPG